RTSIGVWKTRAFYCSRSRSKLISTLPLQDMSSGLESLPEVPTGKTNGSAAETQGRFDYGMGDDKRLAIFDGSYRAGSKLLASRFGPKAGLALSLGGCGCAKLHLV